MESGRETKNFFNIYNSQMITETNKLISFLLLLIPFGLFFTECSDGQKNVSESQKTSLAISAQGSPIHGANGINFDQNDELYVASVISRTIFKLDKETGNIIHKYSMNDSVQGPDDLTFGPDGSLYWTDILNGEIGRRTSDGIITKQFVAPGVNPITFSDDGRLFVALDFMGDALYEVDPNLINPPRLILEQIGWLNAMDWGPDGFLYGPVWTKGQVIKVDVDSGEIEVVSDQLKMPAAVKFDSRGRLHVLDQMTGLISRVDLLNGDLELVASLVPGLDNLAFDSDDRLFIAHAQDGSVVEVMDDGMVRDVVAGGIITPGGITIMNDNKGESLILSDLFALREIDLSNGSVKKVSRHFIGKPGLISPFTASSDGNHLVLTSWFGNEVQIWDPVEEQSVEEFRDFIVPINAITFQKDLIVAELGSQVGAARVLRHNEEGREVLADATDGLAVPTGLAATDDALWVADWSTGKILQLIKNGEVLNSPIEVASGLSQPEGLAVGSNGELIVVETGAGRVSSLEKNTQGGEEIMQRRTIIDNLPLGIPAPTNAAPTWVFSGIAIGSDGTIYIASDVESKILQIKR